jgi:uncharacterized protein YxjI
MKYQLKRQWFTLPSQVPIQDENGREAFRIGGRPFYFGKKLSFLDRHDNELAFINQKMVDGGPSYEIYHSDDLQAVVREDLLTVDRCKLAADAPAPDDLHAEGNFTDHEYTFTREGKPVGRVSKSLFRRGDSYGVEVGRGEDEVLLLASAAVIDLCCHKSRLQ